ncbi:competence type IV pilus minor pilin ComGD [Facklamia sp. 7083-14-GEN3]|uniref:competence type IV pilus minor pilin ComGD n=1 Tax=Facklamia sp. 7083-14-GEN3 TaxID=2973478 RepID=UPI00215CBA02|nr:competence type IV pilus minor pilin ComGD [Facklamia sp. 7083-14-GEN3]MCR8969334.1 competence type IV pilus minor pilin ComGD [Facklamia sp. 7083-14-GEN3]
MKAKNQSAFTLIEALCVLSVFSILMIFLTSLPYQQLKANYQTKVFKDQLKSQLYLAQDKAIIDQDPVQVVFSKRGIIYFWQIESRKNFSQLIIPKHLKLLNSFSFYYLSSGRINDFETVYFENSEGNNFELVFQLGSGQFVFKEQKGKQSY